MIHNLLSDPLFNGVMGVAGLATGLIGIVLAIYYYLRQRTKKALRYAIAEKELIAPPYFLGEPIGITYRGENVHKVRRVGLLLWNSGDVTFDFAENLRFLGFSIYGRPLLGAYVAVADDPGATVRVDTSGDTVAINFSELRSREGCLFFIDYEGAPAGWPQFLVDEKHKDIVRRFDPVRARSVVDGLFTIFALGWWSVMMFVSAASLYDRSLVSFPLHTFVLAGAIIVAVATSVRGNLRRRMSGDALSCFCSEFGNPKGPLSYLRTKFG